MNEWVDVQRAKSIGKNDSYLPTALFALRYYATLLFVVNNEYTMNIL